MAIDLFSIWARINERLGMGGYPGGSVDAPDSISWDVSFGNLKFLFATSTKIHTCVRRRSSVVNESTRPRILVSEP